MAIQIVGADPGLSPRVDPRFEALRVRSCPTEANVHASLSAPTGAMTGLTVAATVFSLRYTGSGVLLIRRLMMQMLITTAFSSPQRLEYYAYIARSWTAPDSAGTALNAASGRHRTSYPSPAYEARIASAAAVTAGTRSLDPHPFGIAAFWAGGVGATLAPTALMSQDPGDHPIVLAQNEGIVIVSLQAMGLTGVGVGYVTCEFAEAASY